MRKPTDRSHIFGKHTRPALAFLCFLMAGCATTPTPEAIIHQSQKGAVYLEPIANRYLQAAHPISLSADTISRVLRGVLVQGEQSAVESIFETQEKARRAFSNDEVTFLTPLLVTALSRATPSQQIRFRLTHPPRGQSKLFSMSESGGAAIGSSEPPSYGPQFETSTGTLYVYGLSLYLTLTEYRQKPSRPDSINMPNRRPPDTAELDRIEILFTPKSALRPESYQKPGLLGESHLTPIIIDYELLAKLPEPKAPASQPASRPPQSSDSDSVKTPAAITPSLPPPAPSGPGKQVETELEALKEELKTIKKQLAEQEADRPKKPAKKKTKPAPPSSSPQP
ncbi:MAG: hypothetical protein HY205_07600 [Nitrospirae bacterium]|nr:hypothetical protein [Nitrospirota bacterium]